MLPLVILLIVLLIRYPITVLVILLVTTIIKRTKQDYFLNTNLHSVKPESGDILIYVNDKYSLNILEDFIWDGFPSLFSSVPVTHYAFVIDDVYYVETKRSNKHYDNWTKTNKNGTRLGKLKYIKDDARSHPYVIKTNLEVTENAKEEIKRKLCNKTFWESRGCLSVINTCINIINKNHKFCLLPQDFIKKYGITVGKLQC